MLNCRDSRELGLGEVRWSRPRAGAGRYARHRVGWWSQRLADLTVTRGSRVPVAGLTGLKVVAA